MGRGREVRAREGAGGGERGGRTRLVRGGGAEFLVTPLRGQLTGWRAALSFHIHRRAAKIRSGVSSLVSGWRHYRVNRQNVELGVVGAGRGHHSRTQQISAAALPCRTGGTETRDWKTRDG